MDTKFKKRIPKIKTKSGAEERFKFVSSGKVKRKHALKSHILTREAEKRKLALIHATLVHTNDEASVKKQLDLE